MVSVSDVVNLANEPMPSLGSGWFDRLNWQDVVFAERSRRSALLAMHPSWALRRVTVRVHRNQAFEYVASALDTFAAYAGYAFTFSYGDYDDSLSFLSNADQPGNHDLELFWIDADRYRSKFAPGDFATWLGARVASRRALSRAPLLVTEPVGSDDWASQARAKLADVLKQVSSTVVVPLDTVAQTMGAAFFDERNRALNGMPLSDQACVNAARTLAFTSFPVALEPRVKAIAVDLDETLHQGVLGEDGVNGVVLTAEHARLQSALLRLRERGLFLALVSKNDSTEVERLFAERKDYPLRLEHFSATSVGWGPKSEALRQIAIRLRISPDAILFIDDNPGELAEVAHRAPTTRLVRATDPATTTRIVDHFPALHGYPPSTADDLRAHDLEATAEREQLATSTESLGDYLEFLSVELRFRRGGAVDGARVAELSNKTNQFNTSFARLTEADVAATLANPTKEIVTVALSDKLSNSGVIAAITCHRQGTTVVVEDLVISCRALGRRLEDVMVLEALRSGVVQPSTDEILFNFTAGPRSEPAREWLAQLTGVPPLSGSASRFTWNLSVINERIAALPVKIEWEVP